MLPLTLHFGELLSSRCLVLSHFLDLLRNFKLGLFQILQNVLLGVDLGLFCIDGFPSLTDFGVKLGVLVSLFLLFLVDFGDNCQTLVLHLLQTLLEHLLLG